MGGGGGGGGGKKFPNFTFFLDVLQKQDFYFQNAPEPHIDYFSAAKKLPFYFFTLLYLIPDDYIACIDVYYSQFLLYGLNMLYTKYFK